MPWEETEGGEGGWGAKLVEYEMGFRNWRRSGGLNKGGLDESGGEAGEGTKRRWPACWGRPTHQYFPLLLVAELQCTVYYWLSPRSHLE